MHGHAPPPHRDTGAHAPWRILVLLALAQFMVVLDVTVVNVALPSIGTDLGFAPADLPWVMTAYVLLTGGLMLLGGRVADLVGRRRAFLAGLAVFTVASLASGLAPSPGALVASRAAQGAGAALLLPAALALVTTTYGGAQRAVALGVWGALGSAGVAVGVLLGGVLTDALSWEWIFWINVPVGLAVGLRTLHVVPAADPVGDGRGRLDVRGAASLTAGLLTLVYALQGTEVHGWGSARTLVLLGGAALLLAAFAAGERRAPRPLVPPSLWRVRSLVTGAATMLGATGLLVGAFYLNTLYLQLGLGYSPLDAGLAFLPLALVILLGAHVASRVMPRTGSRSLVVGGLALVAAGALVLHGAPAQGSYAADLLPGFLVLGFGTGLTFVSVSVSAMADVGHDEAGLASGLMTTAHEVGAALGVAVLAAAGGYADGFAVEAAVAIGLALLAAVTAPSVRPAPGAAMPAH